jgi:hypothetical protein
MVFSQQKYRKSGKTLVNSGLALPQRLLAIAIRPDIVKGVINLQSHWMPNCPDIKDGLNGNIHGCHGCG